MPSLEMNIRIKDNLEFDSFAQDLNVETRRYNSRYTRTSNAQLRAKVLIAEQASICNTCA
jgi:hypothetical protein